LQEVQAGLEISSTMETASIAVEQVSLEVEGEEKRIRKVREDKEEDKRIEKKIRE
jgi:hypothetical protein